jgi:hypothetical protein
MTGHGEIPEPVGNKLNAGDKKVDNPWRKGWRSIFLLGVTVALVLLGLIFKHKAANGAESPTLETVTPQVIGVFSTDPNATIRITAQVFWRYAGSPNGDSPFEAVYVSARVSKPSSSSAILITSSRPAIKNKSVATPDQNYRNALFYEGAKPFRILDSNEYVDEIPLKLIQQFSVDAQRGFLVGFFTLPQITQESNGSFFAHLPAIGVSVSPSYVFPFFISESDSFGQSEKLIEGPQLKNISDYPVRGYASSAPSKYQAPPGQHLRKSYWRPASLTVTEILENVQSEFNNAIVNNIVPSDGHLMNSSYVWQANGILEPTMNLTNQDATASHSAWDFRSGIAFGVAAGTGVAFIQEENNPLLSMIGRFFSLIWLRVRRKLGAIPKESRKDDKPVEPKKIGRSSAGLGWPP